MWSKALRRWRAEVAWRCALVTGASTGLGAEFARQLAADGCDLVLTARRPEALEARAVELRSEFGVRVRTVAADLATEAGVDAVVAAVADLELDLLVNNAGFGQFGPWIEQPADGELGQLRLNVEALTRLTRSLVPGMLRRGRGSVLQVASTAGFQPGPGMAVYYASKAYVVSFSEALSEELRGTGVHVGCLCPGPTATEFHDRAGIGAGGPVGALGMMSTHRAVRAGLRGLARGRVVIVPGLRNRLGTWVVRWLPRRWTVRTVAFLQRSR